MLHNEHRGSESRTFMTFPGGDPLDVPVRWNAAVFDVDLTRDVPFTHVTVNGSSGDGFFFDTGSPLALAIFDRFAFAHPAALPKPASVRSPTA